MLADQTVSQEFNQLSEAERDRRWQRIREEMSRRGVDCLLLNGNSGRWNEMHGNIRYVSGYADELSGVGYAIFPLAGEGTLITQMQAKRSAYAMSWFKDIRGMSTLELIDILAERVADLGLERGTLGLVGITFRRGENIGLSWNLYQVMRERLPNLKLVDVTDLFFELRSVKSDEEVECLARSARLVDIGFRAHVELARPGVTEREVYVGVVRAMDAAGAEPPTFLLLGSGPMPGPQLTGDFVPSNRVLQRGDVICSETSPKWAGYQSQGLQCFVLGQPTPEMPELAKYAAEVYRTCADQLRPGNTLEQVIHAADDVIEHARGSLGDLADALRPICGAAGLGGPDPDITNKELVPNQAFMLEIGPGGRPYNPPQHLYGGYCIVTTSGAPRHLGGVPIEEMLLTVIG
jgi:Xaa-Pro aminopeptidase